MLKAKSGKMGGGTKIAVTAIIAVAIVLVAVMLIGQKPQVQVPGGELPISAAVECPSDKAWSGTLTVQNALNSSGAETYDNTVRFYEISPDGSEDDLGYNSYNQFVTSITDTTSGSVTLTCGKRYAAKSLSVSGAAGDSSVFKDIASSSGVVKSGATTAKINSAGILVFTAVGDSGAMTIKAHQHGNPQVRIYDIENDGYLFFNGTSQSATAWNTTDGVAYMSTTDENTNTTVGSGGSFNIRLEVQSQNDDEDPSDQGVFFLVDAATTVWDTPVVKFKGNVIQEYSDQLNSDEKKAYSAYEYVYFIPGSKEFVQPDKVQVEFYFTALSGVNPAADQEMEIDLSRVGSYASVTDANLLKKGAVSDDSSQTTVYTLWDINFQMS